MINGANYIINKLSNNGFLAYMVGGCVRDIIMNNIPYDYDITTSATPENIMKIFSHTIPTGIMHGTITVIINNNKYEVTTFRLDGNYNDNRHPENVTYTTSLLDDIKRRDFTINAIAYNCNEGYIDYFNGINDINKKIIRTVNNPHERFNEDALRILRGIRFASKFNFEIEKNTFNAIKELMPLINKLSMERVFDELYKMLTTAPYKASSYLYEAGFFDVLGLKIDKERINFLKSLRNKHFEVIYSVLTYNVDNYNLILNKLKCSNIIKSNIEKIHKATSYSLETKEEVKIMLYNLKCENIIDMILEVRSALRIDDCEAERLYKEIVDNNECYSLKTLAINGNDLLSLNIDESKIGFILNELLLKVIYDNSLNKKDILLDILKQHL